MLIQILVRDLATIETLELNFLTGNTIITGETGAGKSIFIEAIELGLGGRASQNLIRSGKEKAEISLCFDVTNFPKVIKSLQANELYQTSSECIIRRIITQDGRSRCFINGIPVTVNLVKELGELLFHIHGQGEQQILLKTETQREMLDRFANHQHLTQEIEILFDQWRNLDKELKNLHQQMQARNERSEYLRYQFEELDRLGLKPKEWEELQIEQHKLTHAETLVNKIQNLLQIISGNENTTLLSQLTEIRKILESLSTLEVKVTSWLENINTAHIYLTDVESELENYFSNLEINPEQLQLVEKRMSEIFNIARKHKVDPSELLTLRETILQELNALNASEKELQELTLKQEAVIKKYYATADSLSISRKRTALKLATEINKIINSLSLPHGKFSIEFEKNVKETISRHGQEKIIYLIKTNPDQIPQPLAKVISGGELSRLSLALHLTLASRTNIPTLVFDEVDTGLSGAIAKKIGKLLRQLGDTYQVFCITHQAQVAACGHHHLFVEKYFIDKRTHTRLKLLTHAEKTREIARMLGGEKITEKTLAHAKEVLASV